MSSETSKEIKLIVEALSNEKDIPKEVIFEALETALVSATRKRYGDDLEFKVVVSPDGSYETFKLWYVMDEESLREEYETGEQGIRLGSIISLEKGREMDPEADYGSIIEEQVESVAFGRIAAQTAKQVISQRLRAAKRKQVASDFHGKVGELVSGTVKKINREFLIVELANNAEGIIDRQELLPGESFRINDRIRALLSSVDDEAKGPQMILSRTSPKMLEALFTLEVPEIGEGLIEIKGCSRDAGSRSKISVLAKDSRIDPIGACVGMRGARVQAISNEFGTEKIDIVLWDENPAQYVINSLAPAEVESLVLDDVNNSMDVVVSEESLAQVIGRSGQNVRLASQLTGWELNVITSDQAEAKSASEVDKIKKSFMEQLDIDEDTAAALALADFTSLEEIAYVDQQELLDVEGFSEDTVISLREKANDLLLSKAIASESEADAQQNAMLSLDGMTNDIYESLVARGISTQEDLADQSIDDLLEIEGFDNDLAAKLIMSARAIWFEDNK